MRLNEDSRYQHEQHSSTTTRPKTSNRIMASTASMIAARSLLVVRRDHGGHSLKEGWYNTTEGAVYRRLSSRMSRLGWYCLSDQKSGRSSISREKLCQDLNGSMSEMGESVIDNGRKSRLLWVRFGTLDGSWTEVLKIPHPTSLKRASNLSSLSFFVLHWKD